MRQMRSGWADGPAYITQCPIRPGKAFTYNFSVVDQRGTLWWHAHFAWQRASVYGAFIIYPAAARLPPPLLISSPIVDNIDNNVIIFGRDKGLHYTPTIFSKGSQGYNVYARITFVFLYASGRLPFVFRASLGTECKLLSI